MSWPASFRRREQERRRTRNFVVGGFLVGLLLVVGSVVTYTIALKASEKMTVITVEDKESVTVSDGDSGSRNEYRIYTDKGVYVTSDTLIYFNFRSADRYAALKVGKTYECTQVGWRIGVFSAFPNLLDCREISNGS